MAQEESGFSLEGEGQNEEEYHDGDLETALEEEPEEFFEDVVEEIIPEDAAAEIADLEPDLEEALAELGDDHQFGEIEGDVLAELAAPLEEEVDKADDGAALDIVDEEEIVVDDVQDEIDLLPEEEAVLEEDASAEEAEDNEGVQDHLLEAVEGTLRLKRLLSQDDEVPEEVLGKRRRKKEPNSVVSTADEARIQQLLGRWGLLQDKVTRHVLESFTPDELKLLDNSYAPDKFNMKRGPGELVHGQISMLKERASPGGGMVDAIAAFRHRWKLNPEQEARLRTLSHKELRVIFKEFDENSIFEDLLEQAKSWEVNEAITEGALLEEPGLHVMSRFNRLELIDPMAVACIFGDANLSFALKLAKHREAFGHVGRIIATTFETLDCLRERYKEIDETIQTLEGLYTEVWHGVDCTRIAVDSRFGGMEGNLGVVYYNFPHAGAVSGFFDGHPCVNWRHENLMRLFFRALRSFMKPGGLVKVSSSKGAVGVRFLYIMEAAAENEFVHIETMPFMEWHLHRYGRSYGDKRDVHRRPGEGENYNVQRKEADMVYTFKYAPSGTGLPPQNIRLPPKFSVLKACPDGPFRSLVGEARHRHAMSLWKRFVTECSGTHVG